MTPSSGHVALQPLWPLPPPPLPLLALQITVDGGVQLAFKDLENHPVEELHMALEALMQQQRMGEHELDISLATELAALALPLPEDGESEDEAVR